MHKSASQKSATDLLYPSIGPFDQRIMQMPGGHDVYVEQCGNPSGQPVVVLHGGPGGGCSPAMRRFFDPEHYRIILFDQRGCGKSKPTAEVTNNTTWDLVADIERIRTEFQIENWVVFGGSWGATLALVYAQTHPDRVNALILRGVFLATAEELNWFYGGGVGKFWPREWAAFAGLLTDEEQRDVIGSYHKYLFGEDLSEQARYARAWARWESSVAILEPNPGRMTPAGEYARAFARLENHYFVNNAFLDDAHAILNNLDRLAGIHGVIVQGRYDMICPPQSAQKLADGWPGARLEIIPLAGHALSEPGITKALVSAMDGLRSAGEKP